VISIIFLPLRLGLIGFVFIGIVHSYLFIVHCFNRTYVHLSVSEIGFVLHNKSSLVARRSYPPSADKFRSKTIYEQ
jgi:hypothetical protein